MSEDVLRRRRDRLARAIGAPAEILRGTLLERTIRHRQGCSRCARGEGHAALVLTVTYAGGKTRQFTVQPGQRRRVERWLKNYRTLKQRLEGICEINQRLLREEGTG